MTHKATLAVRTGIETDTQHGAVVPPIYLSSNYTFADFGEPRQYDYARSGNPTRTNLADALAALEGGAGAVVTRDIPADSVAVGNPARVIRTLSPGEPRDPALLS